MAMKQRQLGLAVTLASILLGFSLLLSGVSHISRAWWRIETFDNETTKFSYYFGLYEVCVLSSNETCYYFDNQGMDSFVNVHKKMGNADVEISLESADHRNVNSLSCLAILLTGLSFFVSLFSVYKSWRDILPISFPYIQFIITTFAAILGVASVAYAFDKRNAVWPSGIHFLKSKGIATGDVTTPISGFTLQCMRTVFVLLSMFLYSLVAYFQPHPKTVQFDDDSITGDDEPSVILEFTAEHAKSQQDVYIGV